jgi:hypothetical protein
MMELDEFDFAFRLTELIEEARNSLTSDTEILAALEEAAQAVRDDQL